MCGNGDGERDGDRVLRTSMSPAFAEILLLPRLRTVDLRGLSNSRARLAYLHERREGQVGWRRGPRPQLRNPRTETLRGAKKWTD